MRDDTTELATSVASVTAPGSTCAEDVITQQPTGFVAGQHSPAVRRGNPDRAAVCVGIQRDGDLGVYLGGQVQQRVDGARLLGVRE